MELVYDNNFDSAGSIPPEPAIYLKKRLALRRAKEIFTAYQGSVGGDQYYLQNLPRGVSAFKWIDKHTWGNISRLVRCTKFAKL